MRCGLQMAQNRGDACSRNRVLTIGHQFEKPFHLSRLHCDQQRVFDKTCRLLFRKWRLTAKPNSSAYGDFVSDIIIQSSPLAPEAQPLLESLIREYDRLYGAGSRPGGARAEVFRYPASAFAPPLGDFLLLQRNGQLIAGGAFMSHDDETAEIKRVWTHPDHRRQGLAKRVVAALEDSAARQGYTRAYLTTGFRQPEAASLYVTLGYRPLFDVKAEPALYRSLAFEKLIGARSGQTSTTPQYEPAVSFEEATARMTAVKADQEARIAARLDRAHHRGGVTL